LHYTEPSEVTELRNQLREFFWAQDQIEHE
jgi:hypothetical protein